MNAIIKWTHAFHFLGLTVKLAIELGAKDSTSTITEAAFDNGNQYWLTYWCILFKQERLDEGLQREKCLG
jgi:hypothetical protein